MLNSKIKYAKLYYPHRSLRYEGFMSFSSTRNEWIPSGQGIRYFENGNKQMEGCFGNDWFIESGTEYYENGYIKFIGEYNKGPRTYYGPRYFIYGKLFNEAGILWYQGTFHIKRSSIGYPIFENQKSFMTGFEFNMDGTVKYEYENGAIKKQDYLQSNR